MALYLTNIAMLHAQRNLAKATKSLDTTYQRLSSGLRINSAKDDPAGLQIANRMTTEINGLYQANRNTNDGISVAQTIDGALDEVKNMLQRIRTLAVQSANGTNTTNDRVALSKEASQLCQEITRIACRTTFAGAKILCGVDDQGRKMFDSQGRIKLQVGAHAGDTVSITGLSAGFSLRGIASLVNVTDGGTKGYIEDADGIFRFALSTAESSETTLGQIDKFINAVSSKQADMGAIQNRLESVIRLNEVTRTNMSDARARIMDTDYVEEASNLSAQSILQQVAASMLARVSQQKNIILQLLQ